MMMMMMPTIPKHYIAPGGSRFHRLNWGMDLIYLVLALESRAKAYLGMHTPGKWYT